MYKPANIYNADETGRPPNKKSRYVLVEKGNKDIYKFTSRVKGENISAIAIPHPPCASSRG